jgi:DNA anti-recombination protein RmuC
MAGNPFNDPQFENNPFDLEDLKEKVQQEMAGATADLQTAANQILDQIKALNEMKDKANTSQQDLAQKTKDVKDDLAAFENRFGAAGQKVGGIIRNKVTGFLGI